MGGRGYRLVAFLILALLPRIASAAGGSVSVTLSPKRLAVGDTARLTLEVQRAGFGSFRFAPRFELDNFEKVGGPVRQENVSVVDGKLSQSYALTWYLAPQRPGKARVHGVELDMARGQKLSLPDQEAWVDEARKSGPAVDENGRDAEPGMPLDPFGLFGDVVPRPRAVPNEPAQVLLRAEVTPASPWAGEQILYTLYVLREHRAPGEGRVVIDAVLPPRTPSFQGFWAQELPLPVDDDAAEMVQLDGKVWWRQPVARRALFPYEPGKHSIDAAEADVRIIYFRPVAYGFGEEPVRGVARRQSNPVQVAVRVLPPAPAGYGGAVGPLQASWRLQPARVAAGEPAILTAEISGNGNLSGLPDPKLPVLLGLQLSPPEESSRQKIQGTRLLSTRTWTWSLVPQRAGAWALPPLEWVAFEPARGAYRTVSTAALKLDATPAAPIARPAPAAPAPARASLPSAWNGPVLWAVGGAAGTLLLCGLGILIARLLGRDRKARRQLVAEVTAALGEAHPRQAAGAAEEAWRSFLGARYDLPVEAPPTHWAGLLAKRGLGPALAGELVRLVDDLHYLRYAPRLASTDSLQRELLERSRRLARRLR